MDACDRAAGNGVFPIVVLAPVSRAMLAATRSQLSGRAQVRDTAGLGDAGGLAA